MGGKTNITDALLQSITDAVENGAGTDKQVADSIGVPVSTYNDWKHGFRKNGKEESAKIRNAIEKGEELRRAKIAAAAEDSLLKLIVGYDYEETVIEHKSGDRNESTEKTMTKHCKPNATAIIFALCNNLPDKYKSINKEITILKEAIREKHVIGWDYAKKEDKDTAKA
jgi:DNA-binding transcriptional regulator YdaS (Cro superfamily)